ncbi:MAG TPA: hypothetical protein V6C85_08475 [Allocoleopsis sp.]
MVTGQLVVSNYWLWVMFAAQKFQKFNEAKKKAIATIYGKVVHEAISKGKSSDANWAIAH